MQQQGDRILVIGAGISGIRAALDLAESGHKVFMIDQADHIGGLLAQLDRQFPANSCGMCRMLPTLDRDSGSQFCLRKGFFHDNIDVLTATELVELEGEPGRFSVRLRSRSQWVDPEACVGCGLCVDACPVEMPDAFNQGLSVRKAIYRPVPHAVLQAYVIDPDGCTRCGACEKVCPTAAVHLGRNGRSAFPILVVDDEAVIRDSLKEWMISEGFLAVESAASGAEALEILARQPYQLMLADIKMPGMDGVELLKRAREAHPELTVIMMTAYATVETAVEAMKIGAKEYFMKPFDPQEMMPLVTGAYDAWDASRDMALTVPAVILAAGSGFFAPSEGVNSFAYGINPHVVTQLEFERILSGSGPSTGRLLRPTDGKPIARIAWLQCVGSRDIHHDHCSTICCMATVKEALWVDEISGGRIEGTVYYMDLRATAKQFQHEYDRAAALPNIRFERARVHSISPDPRTGDPVVRALHRDGSLNEAAVDLVVLALGQHPAAGMTGLAEAVGLEVNRWGFVDCQPFSPVRTSRPGIFCCGAAGGLKTIAESVIQASAAALEAGLVALEAAKPLVLDALPDTGKELEADDGELPRVLVVVCTCLGRLDPMLPRETVTTHLMSDPSVSRVIFLEKLCTPEGWRQVSEQIADSGANRLLIGACHPLRFEQRNIETARKSGLAPGLISAVDVHAALSLRGAVQTVDGPVPDSSSAAMRSTLAMGLAKVKHVNPVKSPGSVVAQQALVVGGGIAGMTAALGIANMGFGVDLVEQSDQLGGNLQWLDRTLDGHEVAPLLTETVAAVTGNSLITCRFNSRVVATVGQVGVLHSTVETLDPGTEIPSGAYGIDHGVMILATGGREAATSLYGYGRHPAVITQKTLEHQMADRTLDARNLNVVTMILCVGSRQSPRNYCSRVCCPTALKHALVLKAENPDLSVYVLYRDMMTPGFWETYFTQARQAGVIFIPYTLDNVPQVSTDSENLIVAANEPLLDRVIEIKTDLLVLATGITPNLDARICESLEMAADDHGFFQEADPKWRPVESIRHGIFACGLALAPGTIADAVTSGQAVAQQALRILGRSRLPVSTTTASVRTSLCTLCRRCIDVCAFGARWVDDIEECLVVNPALCQGCGACAAECPNGAAVLEGQSKTQVLEMIDAALI